MANHRANRSRFTPSRVVAGLGALALVALGGVAVAGTAGTGSLACQNGTGNVSVGAEDANGNVAISQKCTVPLASLPHVTDTVTAPAPPAETVTKTETVTASPSSEPTTAPPSSDPTTPSSSPSTSTPSDPPPTSGCASSVKNDADGPDPWGGCWPGPSSTGASGTLTPSGSITVSQANAVVQNLKVSGYIYVRAPGVTIKNVEVDITSGSAIDVDGYTYPGSSATISNVTIKCGDVGGTTGIEADSKGTANAVRLDVDHTDISRCENGFDADENFTVSDSYLHDLANTSDSHTDGIQSSKSNNFNVQHNVIYSMKDGSPANDGTQSDWTTSAMINAPGGSLGTFQKNLLAGGAYSYYCVRSNATDQQTVDNLFSQKFGSKVGWFGPQSDCQVAGNTFTGNQYVVPGSDPSGSVKAS